VPGVAEYLKTVLRSVREFHLDWYLEEIGVERDHVQLHMVIPLKYAVSRGVEALKGVTSWRLKEKFHTCCTECNGMVAACGHEDFSRPRWASTKPRFGIMSGTKASRRRVKRSLKCKETPPGRAWKSTRPPKLLGA